MHIDLTYLLFWLLLMTLVGHKVIIKKIQKTALKHPNSKAEMCRAMVHLLITIALLPLELFFNFWRGIEER